MSFGASGHCTNCGSGLAPDGRFCDHCGAAATPMHLGCPACSAALQPDSVFCDACGVQVGQPGAAGTQPAMLATAQLLDRSGPDPQPQRTKRPWRLLLSVAAGALVAASTAAVVTYLLAGREDGVAITLEPVDFAQPDDFVGNLDADVPEARRAAQAADTTRFDVIDDPRTPRLATALSGQVADGGAPALYGGSRDTRVCDVEALVGFLTDEVNVAKARAWAGVQGIAVGEIEPYVRGLTAARLSFDTRVTNHGFAEDEATADQSLLQAGTAVLVDRSGVPRVSCTCGNPLLEPAGLDEGSDEQDALELEGSALNPEQAWEGLDPERAVTIEPASDPVEAITLLDRDNADGLLERPIGSDGQTQRDTGTGDVKVTLEWESDADLDLHVFEPDGTEIAYSNRGPTATGGELDVDANIGCDENGSLENVFWPPGEAPPGDYRIEVNGFKVDGCGGGDFTLTIQVAGEEPRVEFGSVGQSEDAVFSFTSSRPREGILPGPGTDEEPPTQSPDGSDTQPLSADSQVSTQGVGAVLAGMSLEDAEAAAGTELVSNGPDRGGCGYVEPEGLSGVSFMTTNGRIARADVIEPVVATMSGLRVGDSEDAVYEEYGTSIERTEHEYEPDGSYLTYVPDDPADETRIVFETDGSEVTIIRAGRLPEVEYVEGCS